MIWPWSFEWKGWQALTVTFALIATNLFFYMLSKDLMSFEEAEKSISVEELALSARMYHQYLGNPGRPTNEEIPPLLNRALQDAEFIRLAPHMEFRGDQVAIRQWKETWRTYHEYLKGRVLKIFGFSLDRNGFLNAVSYQFVHANVWHLLSNLVLLFLFGGAIELMLGGLWVVALYLLGGMIGGVFYLAVAEPSLAPMVGASVSVSALIGFYLFAERRPSVRFIYFLSPIPGYFGEIWLSKWVLIPLFLLSDLSAILKADLSASSVAHLGHVGGLVFGLLCGAAVTFLLKLIPQWEQNLYASYSPSHIEAPES